LKISNFPPLQSVRRQLFRILGGCCFLLLSLRGLAQESIRPSNAGSLASEARHGAPDSGNYVLKLGPVNFSASAGLGIEYNDNIGLSENHRESDLILRPTVELDGAWRVTSLNTLRFKIGVGYAAYMDHSDLNTRSILLDPDSQVDFDVYVGGFLKLNFHDRFAILQNPIDEPNISNAARFDRFQNTAGVTGLFDFNDLKLVLGYDHFTYNTFSNEFDFLDRAEEQFFASGSLQLSDAVIVGVDGHAAVVNYHTDFNNNGTMWGAGPFLEATLSNYTTLRVSGGYQGTNFDQSGASGDTSNYSGWYANVTIAHRLNQYWSHSLSAGHEARLGLEVNFSEYTYVRYLAQWQINSRLHASIEGFAESSNESGTAAQNSEDAFRWGGGVSLGWRLSSKLSMDLGYHYVNKNSNLPLRDYYQNVGTLLVRYQF
jgi:hypothetical protein